MARKKSLEELDAEMARLEAELRALEEGRAPPAPEPEDEEPAEAPADEAEEAAPKRGRLKGRFKRRRGAAEEVEAPEEEAAPAPEEADAPEAADEEAQRGGLMGRLRRKRSDAPEAEATDEPDAERAPEDDESEAASPVAAAEAGERAASDEELPVTPWKREEIAKPHPERWQETQEGWLRRERGAEPAAAEEGEKKRRLGFIRRRAEPEEEAGPPPEAAALLERFEEEPPPEEERKRRLWPLLLALLLLLALIGIIAFLLLGGDDDGAGGGGGVVASVATTGPTTSQGESVGVVGQAVEFDASDTQGTVDEYEWDFGDGATDTTTEPETTHAYTQAGTYTVTLAADGSEDELTIIIVAPPVPRMAITVNGQPVAAAGTVGNNAFVGDAVTVDGSASTSDAEAPIASYAWDITGDSTPEATGAQAELSFSEPGMFVVRLTVTDELGNAAEATQMVHAGLRSTIEDSIGPSLPPTGTANEHPITVAEGRLGAAPVQVRAVLTYTPPMVATPVDDLDLSVVDASGAPSTAAEDMGAGSEEVTVTEISELGAWIVRIVHETGALQDQAYTVVVEIVY